MSQQAIGELARMIRRASGVVVLTGAGISTASGIPDFTSTRGGPSLLSVGALYQEPTAFYRYCLKTFSNMLAAAPNRGHEALAALEHGGLIEGVITQNIDGLHQAAGSKEVLELHGHLRTARCERCFSDVPLEQLLKQVQADTIPPRHQGCGGILVPQVVLFGDPLPPAFGEAVDLASEVELMVVIGTALAVAPANSLPRQAERLAIINLTSTPYDRDAQVVIHRDAVAVLTGLVAELGLKLSE